ncbi:hypothetical protein DPMN_145594 [Dreissena polymorpha]|uniref:Sushi domain-containing protein n=1 Tax=Dreissena polymorpha TaxID=45954 RepID=A0A9D4F6C2_DREPO|nr:hypothetical protein DPMN_145594 [Dreissena polymorpha]
MPDLIKTGIECSYLEAIQHVRVAIIANNTIIAVAQYLCNYGFKLKGNPARICQGAHNGLYHTSVRFGFHRYDEAYTYGDLFLTYSSDKFGWF